VKIELLTRLLGEILLPNTQGLLGLPGGSKKAGGFGPLSGFPHVFSRVTFGGTHRSSLIHFLCLSVGSKYLSDGEISLEFGVCCD